MNRVFITYVSLFTVMFMLFLISVSIGSYSLKPLDSLKTIVLGSSDKIVKIVVDLRLRRAATCIVVGAILGACGTILQYLLRNPLASPYTLGIQSAAALGAGIAIMLLQGGSMIGSRTAATATLIIENPYTVCILAFTFSAMQALLILLLAYAVGLSVYSILLVSAVMSFAVQAVLSLLQYLFFNEIAVAALVFWTFGDVGRTSWVEIWGLTAVAFILLLAFTAKSIDLDLISLGDDIASSSGVNPKIFRVVSILAVALATAVAVSFTGVIGFVGLLAGHMARLCTGWSARKSLPASAILGSIVLLAADIVGRSVIPGVVLPVGITTTIIGVPLLIALLVGGKHGVPKD